jgi:two-component system response regulator HydG
MNGHVLIVDDDAALCRLLAAVLGERGFEVSTATSAADALAVVTTAEIDVILTDVDMTGMNGLELCERIVTNRPDVPVMVLTAFGNLETAIAAIHAGAYDFIPKPPDLEMLPLALERALNHRRLRDEVKRLRRRADDTRGFGELLGTSPCMRQLADTLDRVAESDVSVLITGESGTGKELVARALHRRGRRGGGPFVAINCAAVPEALVESELFGHARGSFTDARAQRVGLFVQADTGTLFLDEIGELPLGLQPKLLRALQERSVRPIGGDAEVPYDVRLIAATNRDLEGAIKDGRFREDLYFRVNVVHVEVPPLRARGNDVLLLAQHFVEHYAAQLGREVTGLTPAAAERLLGYDWPGNVRELQNYIERAVVLARYDRLTVDDLPQKLRRAGRSSSGIGDPSLQVPLDEVERRHILRVLDAVRGNKLAASRLLGLHRKTLYRKLERYEAGG